MIIHDIPVSTVFPKDTVLSLSEEYDLKSDLINKIKSVICRDPVSIDFSYVGGIDASLGIRVDYYGPSIIIRSGINYNLVNDILNRYHGHTRLMNNDGIYISPEVTLLEVMDGSVAGCHSYRVYEDAPQGMTTQGIINYLISKLDDFINGLSQDLGENEFPSSVRVRSHLSLGLQFYYFNRSSEFLRNLYRYYLHNEEERSKYEKFRMRDDNGSDLDLIPTVSMSQPTGMLYYTDFKYDYFKSKP